MAKTLTVFLAADVSRMNRGVKDAERGLTGLSGKLKNMLGPALIGAGLAAGAFAVKLGVDGVKAAIADEAAVAKLTTTLENLGLAHNVEPIEAYIRSLERSLGVSDLELRPAYDRLVRSTQDVDEANRALAIALDVSAGTGKSLDAVVQALGRAYDGNTQGLSRLGAGLDTATLKTGDMQVITGKLAATFGGQATQQAQTFAGQLQRLQTAQGNLGEAFGAGLLKSLDDTNDTTQSFIDTLEDLEPVMESLGGSVADFAKRGADMAVGVGFIVSELRELAGLTPDASGEMSTFQKVVGVIANRLPFAFTQVTKLGDALNLLTGGTKRASVAAATYTSSLQDQAAAARNAATQQNNLSRALGAGTVRLDEDEKAAAIAAEAARDAARAREHWTSRITLATEATETNTRSTGGSTRAVQGLTAAQEKAIKKYEKQAGVVRTSLDALREQQGVLDDARKAFDDYALSIEQSITSNFDLAKALGPAMDEAGEVSGASYVNALNQQITGLEAFANVLTSLKASGAEQSLVDQIAEMGPGAGTELGQKLIDEGLVPTVQGQINTVQELAKNTGLVMSDQFKGAGVEAAINLVDNAIAQVRKDRKKLTKLGDGIGKLIGSGIKKEIANAVAEAVRAAEASKAAARAEAVAAAEARAQAITDQQVGLALSRIISNADARAGRTTNPVLS